MDEISKSTPFDKQQQPPATQPKTSAPSKAIWSGETLDTSKISSSSSTSSRPSSASAAPSVAPSTALSTPSVFERRELILSGPLRGQYDVIKTYQLPLLGSDASNNTQATWAPAWTPAPVVDSKTKNTIFLYGVPWASPLTERSLKERKGGYSAASDGTKSKKKYHTAISIMDLPKSIRDRIGRHMASECFSEVYQGDANRAISSLTGGKIYWIQQGDEILSMLMIQPERNQNSYDTVDYYIWNVCTPVHHRSHGYAKDLIAFTIQNFKEDKTKKDVDRLFLQVLYTNTHALKLYTSIGFKRNDSRTKMHTDRQVLSITLHN